MQTALLCAGFALAGCGSILEARQYLAQTCPPVHILNGADRMRLAESGVDVRITRLGRACDFVETGRMEVQLFLRGRVEREEESETEGGASVEAPVRVALIDPKGRMIARETVSVPVRVASGAGEARFKDGNISVLFTPEGPGYRILAGFALPRDQWEVNAALRPLPKEAESRGTPIILRSK